MPFYQKRGQVPNKRHIQFRDENGKIYWEELISREGFSYIYSNSYHLYPPTGIEPKGEFLPLKLKSLNKQHRHYHVRTRDLKQAGDAISARVPLFFNKDVILSKGNANTSMNFLYRNGHFDECIFIHSGTGSFHSNFGEMNLIAGDYLIIPRGIIWEIKVDKRLEFLVIETTGALETPSQYRNRLGQLLEHAPYCERDIKTPKYQEPISTGSATVKVRLRGGYQTYLYQHHPFDLKGWDGYYFPWIFNIHDFMPITGKIHQPPPIHQTFQAPGLVICSFVPRLFDYHPQSVPAPYAHSNVDSDEILYYVKGNFMSRRGIEEGSITFHPSGIPHGPQPGKIEESLGVKGTDELAIMIDTFEPLQITDNCSQIDDNLYPLSWRD